MRYQLRYIRVRTHRNGELTVRDTGIEPVTPSVSGKCSTAELIALAFKFSHGGELRGGNGNRTRVHGFAGRCLATRPFHREAAASVVASKLYHRA